MKFGFFSEGEALESLWESAPDVTEAFDAPRRTHVGRWRDKKKDVHVHDLLAGVAEEVRRLRKKLLLHGIDPDDPDGMVPP